MTSNMGSQIQANFENVGKQQGGSGGADPVESDGFVRHKPLAGISEPCR